LSKVLWFQCGHGKISLAHVVDDETGGLSLSSSCRTPPFLLWPMSSNSKHYHQYSCKQYGCMAAGEFGGGGGVMLGK